MVDKIEILSVELLDKHRLRTEELKALAKKLKIALGWHYLLDLTWILDCLGPTTGKQVMDAGAGRGLIQWYLIEHGAVRVFSVDRGSRADIPMRFRVRYHIRGLRKNDLGPASSLVRENVQKSPGVEKIRTALRGAVGMISIQMPKNFPGRLLIYNQDLAAMPDIPDGSLDTAVAVSALEHNTPEGLEEVVAEIMRKLRPGGKLLATLGAAKEKDWFHEPSQGWNYTDNTLRRVFGLSADVISNYEIYDELFAGLKNCAELRDNLAPFYARSGKNGMPWGKWDPQYQPVGICKVKSE